MKLNKLNVVVFHDYRLENANLVIEQFTNMGLENIIHIVESGVHNYTNMVIVDNNQQSYNAVWTQINHYYDHVDLVVKLNYHYENEIQFSDLNHAFQVDFYQVLLSNLYLLRSIVSIPTIDLMPKVFITFNLFQKDLYNLDQNIVHNCLSNLFYATVCEYQSLKTKFFMINKVLFDPIVIDHKILRYL